MVCAAGPWLGNGLIRLDRDVEFCRGPACAHLIDVDAGSWIVRSRIFSHGRHPHDLRQDDVRGRRSGTLIVTGPRPRI